MSDKNELLVGAGTIILSAELIKLSHNISKSKPHDSIINDYDTFFIKFSGFLLFGMGLAKVVHSLVN